MKCPFSILAGIMVGLFACNILTHSAKSVHDVKDSVSQEVNQVLESL